VIIYLVYELGHSAANTPSDQLATHLAKSGNIPPLSRERRLALYSPLVSLAITITYLLYELVLTGVGRSRILPELPMLTVPTQSLYGCAYAGF
jgi:hypothetical protein